MVTPRLKMAFLVLATCSSPRQQEDGRRRGQRPGLQTELSPLMQSSCKFQKTFLLISHLSEFSHITTLGKRGWKIKFLCGWLPPWTTGALLLKIQEKMVATDPFCLKKLQSTWKIGTWKRQLTEYWEETSSGLPGSLEEEEKVLRQAGEASWKNQDWPSLGGWVGGPGTVKSWGVGPQKLEPGSWTLPVHSGKEWQQSLGPRMLGWDIMES